MKISIAGVDEVGRGSLIGPVYAAAVIFKNNIDKKKIRDSKKMTKKNREILEKYIKKNSYWSIGYASLKEIEKLNKKPSSVLIDGNKTPKIENYNLKSVVKGDEKIPEISAASIIAKVARDRLIRKLSKKFTKYKWDKNAGYGTKHHLRAIKKFGVTIYHRKTFRPIHNILSPNKIT